MPLKILTQLYSTNKNKTKKHKKEKKKSKKNSPNNEEEIDLQISSQSSNNLKNITKKSKKSKKKEEEEIPVNYCEVSSSDSSDGELISKWKGNKRGEVSTDEEDEEEFQYEISQLPVIVSSSSLPLRHSSPTTSSKLQQESNNNALSNSTPNNNNQLCNSGKSEEFEADSEEDSNLNNTNNDNRNNNLTRNNNDNKINLNNLNINNNNNNNQKNNNNNDNNKNNNKKDRENLTETSANILQFIDNNDELIFLNDTQKHHSSESLFIDNNVNNNNNNSNNSNNNTKNNNIISATASSKISNIVENYKKKRKLSFEISNRTSPTHSPPLTHSSNSYLQNSHINNNNKNNHNNNNNNSHDENENENENENEQTEITNTKKIQWQMGGLLGSGSYGQVRMGLNTENGELMAVKQVPLPVLESTSSELISLQQEIEILRSLNHKHIVRYLGTSIEENMLNIFLECVPGGSLHSLLVKMGPFNEDIVAKYTKQILLGLEYLHSHSIIHRDIKGANILVDSRGIIKLADFGASKKIEGVVNSLKGQSSLKGTSYWMAPEIARQQTITTKSDIWSLGCTVVEMATGKPPFCEFSDQVSALFHIASLKQRPTFDLPLSSLALNFLKKCFHLNPEKRSSATELLKHPFIVSKNGNSYSSPDYRQAGLDVPMKTTLSGSLARDDPSKKSSSSHNYSSSSSHNLSKGYAQPVASPFMYLRKSSELLNGINQNEKSDKHSVNNNNNNHHVDVPPKRNSHSRKPSDGKKKFKFFD